MVYEVFLKFSHAKQFLWLTARLQKKRYKGKNFWKKNIFYEKESYFPQSVLVLEHKNSQEKKADCYNL